MRALHERRHREEEGRFLIDGPRLVAEALNAGAPVEQLIVADPAPPRVRALVEEAEHRGIPTVTVAPHVLEAISDVESPQGIAAMVAVRHVEAEALLTKHDLILLVADRIQDPGNLGTMIRTADAAGASGVALTAGTVDAHNPKVVRATMGSIFHLPVFVTPVETLRTSLRVSGVRIIAADPRGSVDYREADYRPPVAIVVGNEAEGVDPEWAKTGTPVRIPLYGLAESLNAAVAAALLLYEAARPRVVAPRK